MILLLPLAALSGAVIADAAQKHTGLRRDYASVQRGEMGVEEFAKSYGLKAVPRLPQGDFTHYDCGSHAQRFSDKMYGRGKWKTGEEISWADAQIGDWVEYDGWHIGVIINSDRRWVESCWGVEGVVFQHPADVSPYKNPRVVQVIQK